MKGFYVVEKVIDFVQPKGKWKFNEEVAKCFDNMLERSIPDYQNMRKLEKLIINNSVSNKHTLLDIGCSNGINIDDFCNDMKCYGIDISEPMLQQARERFVKNNNVIIEQFNVLTGLNSLCGKIGVEGFDIITSVLTIQFTPIEYRQSILSDIYNHLNKNGVFIFVEKILGSDNVINNMLVKSYYDIKSDNGYSYDAINRKKKSLEGVLVPVTSNWNRDLLKQAGFTKMETFWKCLNFEGIVALK